MTFCAALRLLLTCVQEIQRLIQRLPIIIRIASKHYESVSNQQTGVSNPRTGSLTCRNHGVCLKALVAALDHPQITSRILRPYQPSHDVDVAVLAGNRVGSVAVSGEW